MTKMPNVEETLQVKILIFADECGALETFRDGYLVRSTAATKPRFVPTNLDLVEENQVVDQRF